jgi:hypothetical protein
VEKASPKTLKQELACVSERARWATKPNVADEIASEPIPLCFDSHNANLHLRCHLDLSSGFGSFLWGEVATRLRVRRALLVAAGTLAASLAARLRYRIEIDEEDMTPAIVSPIPKIVCDFDDDDGPVRVLIEYSVPEANARASNRLLRAREHRRRRDGAIEWGLYRDVSKPTRRLETFVVDSWAEHERQHSRTTATDRRSSARIAALLEPGTVPVIGHFMASEAWESKETRIVAPAAGAARKA